MARPSSRSSVPTVRDIASRAGVSTGTVSRALKGQPGLTEETRQMVLDVAQDLGYDLGKLRPVKARRVAFLLNRLHASLSANAFYSPVLHGVEVACQQAGVALTYASVGPDDSIDDLLKRLEADALLCAGYFEPQVLRALAASGKPLVLIDHHHADLPSVNTDNETGGYLATRHLIISGRRRVAHIEGPQTHFSLAQRRAGYLRALAEAGRRDGALEVLLDRVEQDAPVREVVQALLALPQPPDAIFAFNDSTALQAMTVLQEAGVRVPEEMAVAGFDDVEMASHARPPLTTVRVDKERLGAAGLELLIAGRVGAEQQILLPVELIVRASSAQAAGETRRARARRPAGNTPA